LCVGRKGVLEVPAGTVGHCMFCGRNIFTKKNILCVGKTVFSDLELRTF
jgi:hypothetical protein